MKHTVFLFTFLFCVLGLIFSAPKAYALTENEIKDNISISANFLNNYYSDININYDDYYYICSYNDYSSPPGFYITFIPKDIEYSLSIEYYGTTTAYLNYSSSNPAYCYRVAYTVGSEPRDNAYFQYQYSFSANLDYDYTHTGDFFVFKSSGLTCTNMSPDIITLVDLDISSVPENVEYTSFDNMNVSYLKSKGFNVSSAYFADEHGTAVYTLPIVTSYQDLPSEYDGMFLIDKSTNDYFRYQVGIMPTSDPNDFSDFWDKYVVVTFNTGTYTNSNVLLSNGFNVYPADKIFGTTTYSGAEPYKLNDNIYLRGTVIPFQTGEYINVGSRWRYDDESLAIPRTITSDLYIAFTYHNYVTDETTGETVDEGGSNSDEYNTFLTNYYKELQNILYSTLTGVDNGASSFSANWAGQTVTATAPYNNNFEFSDNTGKSLFTELFSMGNGFILEAVLGVLGIAIAAYVLFGKS